MLLIDLHYLPSLEYLTLLLQYDTIVLESQEYYQKQSFRNRCQILGANRVENLIVPIADANNKIPIKDVRIDNSQRWQQIHWRTIEAAYRKSPYFEFFADYFSPTFTKKADFLFEFNFEMLSICLQLFRVKKNIIFTENYEVQPENHIFDARGLIHVKKNHSLNQIYCPSVYQQNFGNEFVPNLSIIDLLFCKGLESKTILEKSKVI